MRDAEARFAESTQGAGTGRARAVALLGALGAAIALLLALNVSPASATYAHSTVTAEFGSDGTSGTSISGINTLAFQQANKRLYVLSSGSLYGFSAPSPGVFTPLGGAFPKSVSGGGGDSDMAVDNSAGGSKNNIYGTPDSSEIYGYTEGGSGLGGWPVNGGGEICGVAVDNAGNVWAGKYPSGSSAVRYASSGGSPTLTVSMAGGASELCKLTIDLSNNDLYASSYGSKGVWQYTAASSYSAKKQMTSTSGSNNRLVVNGAKHVLYIGGPGTGAFVKAYDTITGALIETIPTQNGVTGLAVNESNDTLYVATNNGKVKEMPGANIPKATTGEPTGNTAVAGTADPDGGGNITECYFQFGTSTNYGSTQPCVQATPYAGVTPVTASLPGLLGETLYHYRLVVGNANFGGKSYGADKTITPHNVKGLLTEAATAVTRTSAELHASFEGNGEETKYYFEWGISGYETKSAVPPGPSAGSPVFPPKTFLSFGPGGLLPDTTYHFRVVAQNGLGVSPGGDQSFKTLPAVQSLTTTAATGVGAKVATLNGSYVGDASATSYYFEYGKTLSYGTKTPVTSAGSPSGATPLTASISGLELETEYHFRVVATNSLGTTKGTDLSFTTNPAVGGLKTLPATEISQSGVLLNAEFNGNGEETHYYFEYGLTTKYGTTTAVPPGDNAGAPTGVTPLSTEAVSFEAYSTYHYRVVAVNSQGTTKGKDETFETLPAPLPTISGTAASSVHPTGAMMESEINPNRWATVYLFEYGSTTAYGESTEISGSIGSDQLTHPVSAEVSGLLPGTTYHFRAIGINFTGTAYGPDVVFTTPDAPRIEITSVSSVAQSGAHLSASVIPNAAPTTVHFDYGLTSAYGSSTADQPAGSDAVGHAVSADIGSLSPGTTYHFRAVANNAYGTTTGPDQTFTTQAAAVPPVVEPPAKKCKRGFVKRHGKCVKRKKQKKHSRKSTHRHG